MSYRIERGFASQGGKRAINEEFAAIRMPDAADGVPRGVIAAIADGVSEGGGGLEAAQSIVMVLLEDFASSPITWETSVAIDRLLRASTLTAVVLRGQTYTVAHVGDTRAYLIRDGTLECLTIDHIRLGSMH